MELHDSFNKIVTGNVSKRLKGLPEISSNEGLTSEMEAVDSVDKKAGLLLKNIQCFNLSDIRAWLKDIYSLNPDGAMKSTNFKRCVMYLDLEENR